MTNKETEIITVRVKKNIKEELESISDKEKTNLSNLVNKVLTEYVEWGKFVNESQFCTLDTKIIRELFQQQSASKLNMLSDIGSKSFENICEYIHGEVGFSFLIGIMDNWLNSANFQFRHSMIGKSDRYHIKHNTGENFSTFLLKIFSTNMEKIGYRLNNVKSDAEMISFNIEKV